MYWLTAIFRQLFGKTLPPPLPNTPGEPIGKPVQPPKPPAPVLPPLMPISAGARIEAGNALASLINAERATRGLPPYIRHAGLDAFAQAWADGTRVTTSDPHGDHLARFFATFPGGRLAGEVIAPRYATPAEALNAWINEPGEPKPHRDAILNREYTDFGVGVADHNGQRFWVVDMATF